MALNWNDQKVKKQLLEVIRDKKYTSFIAQYLRDNRACVSEIAARRTQLGMSIADLIKSGVAIYESELGIYAADAESYDVFYDVCKYVMHCWQPKPIEACPVWVFKPITLTLPEAVAVRVKRCRCRFARNLEGYAFPAGLSREARLRVEREVREALNAMTGYLAGSYGKMDFNPHDGRDFMIKDQHLIVKCDEYLEKGGFYRDWSEGRGVYKNIDKSIIVWVNEEDHIRAQSVTHDANISTVYNKANRVLEHLRTWRNGSLELAHREEFGWLTSDPTNLGTGMRLSVNIDLPSLRDKMSMEDIKKQLKEWNLSIRSIYGEHADFGGTVYDISNRRRFNITPEAAARDLVTGLDKLVDLDQAVALLSM